VAALTRRVPGGLDPFRPRRETLLVAGALVLAEVIVLAWYVALVGADDLLALAWPFVWMDIGLLAVWRTTPPGAGRRRRRLAVAVAVVYGVVLAYVGGLVGPGIALGSLDVATSARLALRLPPGYSPALVYLGEYVQLSVTPYKLVGYGALSYLLYVTLLDLRLGGRSLAGGLLGLFTCVSCTWPLVAGVLTGALGVAGSTVTAFTPELWTSTAVFVVTVVVLYWRPTR